MVHVARRFGDAGGARCWAGEGKEEQQRVSSKLHADLARGLARACSLGKGQQRAACCAGRVAQMGTGFGPAAAAGEEPSSPQAPSRLQPPRFSSPCFVNSSAGAGGWEQLVNTPFCSSRRVGAARSHPQVFSPRLSPLRPTGVRVGLQVLVPCSSPGGLRVLGRAGPRCEGSSQTSPLCAAESFQLIWSCSEPFSQRGW